MKSSGDAKRILITGGAGFIGHHLVEHIIKNTNWQVIVLDKLTYASSGFDHLRDISCFNDNRVLLLTADFVKPFTRGITKEIGQVHYIIHMGAETHVDRSLKDALPFVQSNVVGTANLLEWIKWNQPVLEKYIQFSTDEVYGPAPEGYFFPEWSTMRPSNPYAASKGGGDLLAYCFAHAFKLPIVITRTMNVVGERQHPEKFVPKTIQSIMKNEKVVLHGKSDKDLSSRCWIHARNVADALLFLLDNSNPSDMYHIVGEEYDILAISNIICQEIKGRSLYIDEIEYVDYHSARPGHDKRYALSGDKLARLGWSSPMNLEWSLRKTVRWMMNNERWLDEVQFCNLQGGQ